MVSVLILGLVFAGCSEITKISSPATVSTSGDLYRCVCYGPDTATGMGARIIEKENGGGTWFMYNEYNGINWWWHIQAGNPKNGTHFIGTYWVANLGSGNYEVRYEFEPAYEVLEEHLAISDTMNFTAKPGKDDNQDFYESFYDEDGKFYIFAHFAVDCAD